MCWRLIFEQRRRGKKMNSEDAKTGRAEGERQTTSRLKASCPLPAFPASLVISLMCLMVLCVPTAGASALHKNAVVKEYDQVFPTFPYSDQIGRASCRERV